MKKCICIILVIAVSILSGCNSSQNEENVFPQNFKEYYEVSPYGNEEEINSLSDVEITLDKKWDFNLENATFLSRTTLIKNTIVQNLILKSKQNNQMYGIN